MARVWDVDEYLNVTEEEFAAVVPERAGSGGKWSLCFSLHPEGGGPFAGRDNALTAFTGFLRAKRIPYDAALPMVMWWNRTYCQPPIEEGDVYRSFGKKWQKWEAGTIPDLTPDELNGVEAEWEILSIAELFAKKDEYGALTWLAENGFAMGHLHIVSAPPKTAKTFIMLSLAHASATGTPWLGRFPIPKGAVLWVDEEMGHQLMIRRLEKLGFPSDVPFLYMGRQKFRLDSEEHVNRLIKYIEAHGVQMVVLDSLRRIHRKKENDNYEMGLLYHPLKRIAETGAAVIVIHHDRKKGAETDVSHEAAAGGGDLIAMMDMAFGVQRIGGNVHRLTCRAPRLVASDVALTVDFALEDSPDGQQTFIREVDSDERTAQMESEQEAAVLAALAGGPSVVSDLDGKLGWRTGSASKVCKRLYAAQLVEFKKGAHNRHYYGLPGDLEGVQ